MMKKVMMITAAVLAMAVGSFAFAAAPPATGITRDNVAMYLPDASLASALALPAGAVDITATSAVCGYSRTCAALPLDENMILAKKKSKGKKGGKSGGQFVPDTDYHFRS